MNDTNKHRAVERAELHAHLGSSVAPPTLWAIAHDEGIRLPTKDYWEFEAMITMRKTDKNQDLDEMHNNFFHWTELIQSSPLAVEQAVRWVISGGYRKCNLTLQELRFNPMFRNRGGERDLDHIITAALHGMDKALLDYQGVRAGLIVMMSRMLTFEQNKIILEKAIKYKDRGIIGIDVACPQRTGFSIQEHATLFKQAREAGLGITLHTGEEGSLDELAYVVSTIKPDRIGHGILAAQSPEIMASIVKNDITLEICPTSNLRNGKVKDIAELKNIIRTLVDNGVKITINTDGPEMYRTNIVKEEDFLLSEGILSKEEIEQCRVNAFVASFIKSR